MKQPILVIGGAGYIGSHVVRMLTQQGYQPVVLDDLSKGHRQAVAHVPLEIGNFGHPEILSGVFKKYDIGAVIHLAAYSEVEESVHQPGKYHQNNTAYVQTLLEVMAAHHIKHVVFSSSAAVFGEPTEPQLSENHPCAPLNPYGASKLAAENLFTQAQASQGIHTAILRYFNAAGADESAEIGESHSPETHLIPLLLQTAAGKRPHFTLFGTDYPTPDGTCIRDFVHVNDLASAHLLALAYLFKTQQSQTFNLGSETGYSVAQVVQMAKEVCGIDFPLQIAPRRPGDPARLVASSQRAQQLLGWHPVRDLKHIIQTAWQWEQHRRY